MAVFINKLILINLSSAEILTIHVLQRGTVKMGAYVWRGLVVFLFVFASNIFVFKIGEVKHKRQKRSPVDEMVQSEVDKM